MSEIEKQVRELFAARLKKADIPSTIRKFFDDLVDLGLKNEDIAIILQGMIDAVRGVKDDEKAE